MGKNSASEAVFQILDQMGYLQLPIENDLINYSALARLIKPAVEQQIGSKTTTDSLIMAVRRYVRKTAKRKNAGDSLKIMANSRIILRTGLILLHLKRSTELYSKLIEIERKNVNWHLGDKMYILQRSDEITVIAGRKFLPLLKSTVNASEVIEEYVNLALLTIQYESDANKTPGIIPFVSTQLTETNTNIYAIFNSITKLSLLVSEEQASRLYERLNQAIEQARQMTNAKKRG